MGCACFLPPLFNSDRPLFVISSPPTDFLLPTYLPPPIYLLPPTSFWLLLSFPIPECRSSAVFFFGRVHGGGFDRFGERRQALRSHGAARRVGLYVTHARSSSCVRTRTCMHACIMYVCMHACMLVLALLFQPSRIYTDDTWQPTAEGRPAATRSNVSR